MKVKRVWGEEERFKLVISASCGMVPSRLCYLGVKNDIIFFCELKFSLIPIPKPKENLAKGNNMDINYIDAHN